MIDMAKGLVDGDGSSIGGGNMLDSDASHLAIYVMRTEF
jgi:hypothetical protein